MNQCKLSVVISNLHLKVQVHHHHHHNNIINNGFRRVKCKTLQHMCRFWPRSFHSTRIIPISISAISVGSREPLHSCTSRTSIGTRTRFNITTLLLLRLRTKWALLIRTTTSTTTTTTRRRSSSSIRGVARGVLLPLLWTVTVITTTTTLLIIRGASRVIGTGWVLPTSVLSSSLLLLLIVAFIRRGRWRWGGIRGALLLLLVTAIVRFVVLLTVVGAPPATAILVSTLTGVTAGLLLLLVLTVMISAPSLSLLFRGEKKRLTTDSKVSNTRRFASLRLCSLLHVICTGVEPVLVVSLLTWILAPERCFMSLMLLPPFPIRAPTNSRGTSKSNLKL